MLEQAITSILETNVKIENIGEEIEDAKRQGSFKTGN